MQIKQLNVAYVTEQDRLLIRVNTSDSREFLLWLTRRMSMRFWPAFQHCILELDSARTGTSGNNTLAKRAVSDFEREKNMQHVQLGTQYETAMVRPLGNTPLLVTAVDMTPVGSDQLQLVWKEKLPGKTDQRSLNLTLQPNLYHGLSHLLEEGLKNSQWQDPASSTSGQGSPGTTPSESSQGYLN